MTKHKVTISQKKYCVYTLAYPEEMGGAIFYVGKGSGKRMSIHEIYAARSDDTIKAYHYNSEKCRVIREIWANGGEVKREIVFETDDEPEAFAYEWALIHMVHRERGLTNVTHNGQRKSVYRPPKLPTTGEPVVPVNMRHDSPIVVEGERLYTANGAIEYLGIPQDAFYRYVKHRIPTYHYGALRREYYRQSDLDRSRAMWSAEEDE